jgi:glycosyltransferase involved in cell wall biosynthesis
MKKKIAVIGLKGLPAYVGAGTVGENIINQLKDEFEFYVYATSSHTELPTGYYNGIYQKVFRKLPLKKFNSFWYYLISALHARYRENFDAVHVHNSFAAFTLGILKRKYPVVLTTHGGFNVVDKWKRYAWFWAYNTNKLVKKADYLCCVSKDEQRKFKNLLNIDAHYIPNGINPINKESLPGIKISEPYIFFGSGRIIRSKGLHDLILALHKIDYKGKLLVAGDMEQIKSYSSEIIQMIGDLDVEFLGLIKEKEILFSYISHARFFVYPSHMEAMSMMLLEAVTVECPIICSDIIPNQDILNPDEVLFFKTKDPDDLAEKISMALSDPDKMKKNARNAQMRFLKEFNWTAIAQEYRNIYNSLINNNLH